jgi:tetratricopeptide (TPR) repeat protein
MISKSKVKSQKGMTAGFSRHPYPPFGDSANWEKCYNQVEVDEVHSLSMQFNYRLPGVLLAISAVLSQVPIAAAFSSLGTSQIASSIARKDSQHISFQGIIQPKSNYTLIDSLVAQGSTADDFLRQGAQKLDRGDYQGAIADFSAAIKVDGKNVLAYTARGIARLRLQDNKGAIEDLTEALRLNPEDSLAYTVRGEAYSNLEQHSTALADFNAAIRLDSKYSYAYYRRGVTNLELKNDREALADFNAAISLDPDYAKAYLFRGLARYVVKDREGGLADLQQAAALAQKQGLTDIYQEAQNAIAQLEGK